MTPEQLAAIASLVGKPYAVGGDGPDAFDCYGLARAVRAILGDGAMPDVPRAALSTREAGTLIARHAGRRRWREAKRPEHGDLVVMANVLRNDHHVGVALRAGTTLDIIHMDRRCGAVVDDLNGLIVKGFSHMRFYRA